MHDIDYSRLMVALDTDPPGPMQLVRVPCFLVKRPCRDGGYLLGMRDKLKGRVVAFCGGEEAIYRCGTFLQGIVASKDMDQSLLDPKGHAYIAVTGWCAGMTSQKISLVMDDMDRCRYTLCT